MKLICVTCGNYVHFETVVEMHQPVRVASSGLAVEPHDADGYTDQGASVRMGVEELVSYCVHNDMETLEPGGHGEAPRNKYITCARCGSSMVSIPYCPWSPPHPYSTLEEEMTLNRKEYTWLRKERERHETDLPGLRR